jgi:outer membrane protein assembly factor BamB
MKMTNLLGPNLRLPGFWLIVVVASLVAGPRPGQAQVFVPGQANKVRPAIPEASGPAGGSLREQSKRFDRAQRLLSEENFAEAARLLQTILDSDEDAFIKAESPAPAGEFSLKVKSGELLAQMPVEGLAAYERQQGPAARRLLDEALNAHDIESIAFVARRYFHTQAGHDAVYHLAADHFDHDRPLLAAVDYERLLAAPGAAGRYEPYLSLRCATSWLRAGLTAKAVEALKNLKQRSPQKTVSLRGRDVELFDDPAQALSWLTEVTGPPVVPATSGPRDWTTVGGDPTRNAGSSGGSPYLNRGWRVNTVEGATNFHQHDLVVAKAFESRRQSVATEDETPGPALPSFQPLIVDNLVIARSIGDVRAYDLLTGQLAWATGEKDKMLHEMLQNGAGIQLPQAQIPGNSPVSFLVASRGWDDATFGTLSSDGELVFVIEDLPLNALLFDQNIPRRWQGTNRLAAYEAKTGRVVWEAGGPRDVADDVLSGSYFLGVPLVLDHLLYSLVETGGDVRLVVLDPRTGRVNWQQTLANLTPTDPMIAVTRRQSGLAPSFAGDILVCPIGAEQIVAVSLSQRTLLWRYRLQQPAETVIEPPIGRMRGMRRNFIRLPIVSGAEQNGWLDSHATIADLKVIVTPRDADELYCLNLQDGSLSWKKPRGEGLFVAGVHQGKVLVVGRSFVSALKLSDGEPAWTNPASLPVPSGRGFIAGDQLHLPLTTAEVATVNLHDGRVVARAKSIAGNIPGNLAAVHGTVVSLGGDFVEAYRQLGALENEIATQLVRNPDDPQALALRGEIQLQRGKTIEAYADLKRALELKSDDGTIRSLLVGSLLEGLRVDFPAYHKLDSEIAALTKTPAEQSTYLWLTAQGLQREGAGVAALDTFLKFSDPQIADQEFERIDGSLVVRRDRLVRARAAELFAAAPPEVRERVSREVAALAGTLREKSDSSGFRRLVRYFGGVVPQAEFDRLNVELPLDTDWLSNEFRLEAITRAPGSPFAAPAQARLGQLYLTADRPRDALTASRILAERWPDAIALDGKTGQTLAREWQARSELAREAAVEAPWPTGLVDVERLGAVGPAATRHFEIPLVGERSPCFQDTLVQIGYNWRDISARDSLGRVLWKYPLEIPVTQGRPPLNRAYSAGHLLVISFGTDLVAIDVLGSAEEPGPRLLWTYSLRSTNSTAPGIPQRKTDLNPRRRFVYNEMGEMVGTIGPVTRDHVTVLAGRKLLALDPLTGKTLWTREGIRAGTELFGDERLIYAVPAEGARAQVFDATDGSILGERTLPPASKRLETLGAHVIAWKTKDERQVLSRFDPWTGKDLWSRDFEDTAQVALIEYDEAAVLEISGKLSIVSLADGKLRFESPTEPEPNVRQVHVIRSRGQYVVIANQPPDMAGWQQVTPQTIPVQGRVYGFDRQTGTRLWSTEVYRQGIDLNQPAELPVLTFVCHFQLQRNNLPGLRTFFGLTCLDKRNGRIVFDNREFDEQLLYVDYSADHDLKQVDLRLFRSIMRLNFTDKPVP